MKKAKIVLVFLMVSIAAVLTLGACGNGGGGSGGGGGGPDLLIIASYTAADVVIGQPDFTSGSPNQGGSADADTLNNVYGDPVLHNGILYLPDYLNRRVLGFNQVPVVNGASADFVIGQPDLTTTASSSAADGASGPQTVQVHNGKLIATMYSSSSVYIYDPVPIANGASADIIVGQTDFGIGTAGCAPGLINGPESMYVAGNRLIVADSRNDRVLIWNSIPIVNGTAADIVLGQTDLDTCVPAAGPPTASTLNYPSGIWSDGKRLAIADGDNNRVLIWSTFPSTNGQPADIVLGQPDMTSNAAGVSDRDMEFPYFLASNGRQLFVADFNNNRVLIWDRIPTVNYTPADGVLGQPDFDCNNANENDGICATSGEGIGPRGLDNPAGLMLTGDLLIVMDHGNSRALVFRE